MLQSLLVCNIAMGNLCNSGPKSDPDSAWKQQNKESKENPMYIFADLAKGGCLVEAYKSVLETEGVEQAEEEVRKIVRTEFPVCLYEGGKGKTVTRADYIRWKYEVAARRNHAYMDENITDQTLLQEYKDDRFNKVEDHPACWRMDKRGGVGETPLHLIFLMDSYIHNQVGYVLLDMYPRLALDFYEGDEYFGESCLHIAIVYGNFELVKRLVECGAEINRRATGQFFLPEDQKRGKIKKQTNYKGYAYYGEYPLAFACSFGNRVIYDYLLDHGADPDLQDSFGNTVLHMAVIADQPEMYKYAYQHHKKPAKPAVKNEAKLTPLTLASKLGRHRIFQEMLELSSIEMWRFSNIMCSVYPLAPLDTISPTGDTNWESALWFIINGETDGHLDMLEGGVVRHLLDDKWKTFAQMRFYKRLVLALFHLLMVSLSVYLRPADNLLQYRGAKDVVRYTAEVITVISCARNVVMSLFEVHSQGFLGFLKNCKHAPAKTLFLVSCVVMLMCVPCRLLSLTLNPASCQEVEDTLLILAVPCAWIFLLFFARVFHIIGPYVVMLYLMVSEDLLKFTIIYLVFILQFAQGFYFLFRDIDDQTITSFSSLSTTIMTLIQMTLGEFRYEEFDNTHYSFLTKLVFGVFMVIVPILLLNMLIAMMGNTYQQVISKSEKEWRRQWAKIVIVLERAYSKEDLRRFQDRYSIKMGVPANEEDKGDDCEHEGHHRGLMVIKACNKTKARQRKGAVNNWKRFGREVMRQLKQQKKDGNDGPLELKTRRRRPKGRSISRDQKDSFDRPSSVESGNIAQNLLSAVDQLAWERKLDYSHGQSLERHVSEMKIPVYDGEEDVLDAGNTRADSKPPVNRRPRREHRPHRNQVEPLRQGSAESSNRSANQTPLLSLPSETSLEFAIGPDGDSSPFGVKNLKPLASSEHDDMPVRIQDDDWFDKIESPRSARRSTSPKGSPQRKPQSSYVTEDFQQDGGSLGEQSRQESPDSKRGSPHRKHRHRHHKHKSHRHKGDSPPERESPPQEGDSPDLNKESPSHQRKSHGHKEESPQRVEESSASVEESPQYGDSSSHDKKTSRHRKRKKEKSSKAASQASLNSVSSQTSLLNAQAEMAGQTNESSV